MRYARRSSRARKGRRGSRTLSTRRIFGNKSARSQAAQINALKKRINRVYRRTKPEYKLLRSSTENRGLGADLPNGPTLDNYVAQSIILPSVGAEDNQRIGNKITVSPINFFLNIRYMERNEIINNAYPYVRNPLETNGMMVRFIALQSIAADNQFNINDIFQTTTISEGTTPQNLMMMMTMPFKNGITTKYRILKDKRIRVTEDSPVYASRIKIKPQIRSMRWEEGKVFPAGMIWYIMISAGGDVQSFRGSDEVDYFNYNFLDTTWRYEIPYTDQ